jgi:hypothetical protein
MQIENYIPPRPLEELTDREVSELTDEKIQRYYDVVAMQLGIALPPEAPPIPEKPKLAKETMFVVKAKSDSHNAVEIVARDIDGAQEIRRAIVEHGALTSIQWFGGDYIATISPIESVKIEESEFTTKASLETNRKELEAWGMSKQLHDSIAGKIRETRRKLEKETEWIRSRIAEAKERRTVVETVRRTRAHYLTLAPDAETAERFLGAAFSADDIELERRWDEERTTS